MIRRPASPSFAGFRFPHDVVLLAVRCYLRYCLLYRDVEEVLAECGIDVDHVTIFWWAQRSRRWSSTPHGRAGTASVIAGSWTLLIESQVTLGDVKACAMLRERFVRLADVNATTGSGLLCFGRADRCYGMPSFVFGELDVAEEHEPFCAAVLDHRFEVVGPEIDVRHVGSAEIPFGGPAPAGVASRELLPGTELGQPVAPNRAPPVFHDGREPIGRLDHREDRSRPSRRRADTRPARSRT